MRSLFISKPRTGGLRARPWPKRLAGLVVLALVVTGLGQSAAPGQTVQLPQIDIAQPYTSVFVDNPSVGKDPFFPRSKRRVSKVPVPVDVAQAVTEGLMLKGLSGSPDRRLAIINNVTLAAGEEGNLRIGGTALKVRCIEIRDRSVIININGLNRELRLRPDL